MLDPEQSRIGMGHDMDRDRAQIGTKASLCPEPFEESSAIEALAPARHDAAGDVHAAAGTEGERKVARDGPEECGERHDGLLRHRIAAGERVSRDLRGGPVRIVASAVGRFECLQNRFDAGAGQRALGRCVSEPLGERRGDCPFPRIVRCERPVPALPFDGGESSLRGRNKSRNAETGARGDHRPRRTVLGTAGGKRPRPLAAEPGKCPGDRRDIVDEQTAAHDAGNLSVIVTSAAATPDSSNTITRSMNYQVDKAAGRLYIEDAAPDITAGTTYYVHYQPAASGDTALTVARTVAQAKTDAAVRRITCALRYIEDAAAGRGRNVYVRKCSLVPGGETSLKSREAEQQMQFTATVQAAGGDWPDIVIDDAALTA